MTLRVSNKLYGVLKTVYYTGYSEVTGNLCINRNQAKFEKKVFIHENFSEAKCFILLSLLQYKCFRAACTCSLQVLKMTVQFQIRLTLIRESWKKNPKRGTITERVLRKKKIQSAALRRCVCFIGHNIWIFFPENTLGNGPKTRIRVYVLELMNKRHTMMC